MLVAAGPSSGRHRVRWLVLKLLSERPTMPVKRPSAKPRRPRTGSWLPQLLRMLPLVVVGVAVRRMRRANGAKSPKAGLLSGERCVVKTTRG
jgi:hypothetical protein